MFPMESTSSDPQKKCLECLWNVERAMDGHGGRKCPFFGSKFNFHEIFMVYDVYDGFYFLDPLPNLFIFCHSLTRPLQPRFRQVTLEAIRLPPTRHWVQAPRGHFGWTEEPALLSWDHIFRLNMRDLPWFSILLTFPNASPNGTRSFRVYLAQIYPGWWFQPLWKILVSCSRYSQ